MNADFLVTNWALIAATGIAGLVAFIVAISSYRRSAYGQLRRARSELARKIRQHRKAERKVAMTAKRIARLGAKAEATKPRLLSEAREAHEDALALEKIAHDKVLVASNHVRRIIVEEIPPARQQRLRDKYLPPEPDDKRPFSF